MPFLLRPRLFMSVSMRTFFTTAYWVFVVTAATAGEPVATARPVPATRVEMKRLLEDMKSRPQRIPLPELTEQDRIELGDRADSYESRLRYHYMPFGETSVFGSGGRRRAGASAAPAPQRDFTRNSDENMSLTYAFKTQLFWIASRTNNCQYCLGHQEQKLSAVGLTDDQIAALDGDWENHTPAERAAFAYARRLTYEPHLISDTDIETLRRHYNDLQILEMTLSVAGNNAINRWKEGTGTPQSQSGLSFFRRAGGVLPSDRPLPIETFLTPTSPEFRQVVSRVAPLRIDPSTGMPTGVAVRNRPPLESRGEVEMALESARHRSSRIAPLSEDDARQALGLDKSAPAPNWLRLMAHFPNEAQRRIDSLKAIDESEGDLSLLLKAQVSWIIARQDRAWYATGLVRDRLRELGQTDDQIFALDGTWAEFTPAERSLFRFARNLAASPIALTDEDVAEALNLSGPRQVVQLIDFVTSQAYFDRVTEAAALPLDP